MKISKVANAATCLPTVDVDVSRRKVMHVVVDGDNQSSAVVNEMIEEEMGCGSVFESNGDIVVTEGSDVVGHIGILVDSHYVELNDVSNIVIK